MKKRKLLLSVLLFAVMGMMTGTAISAPYIEGEATGWNQIGPNNFAGRTRAAVFDKFNDGIIYVGTVGGLYVSVNYGRSWQEIPLGNAVQSVTAITQGDDGRLYVATGEGYYKDYRGENPYGHNNQTSGSVGNGVFIQTQGFGTDWARNLTTDAQKLEYISNYGFEVMTNTKPASKYAFTDDWAYINTILCENNRLYVGTKNSGLKYTEDISNVNAQFSNVVIDGNSSFDVNDICVNANGKIAVAFNGNVAVGEGNNFKVVFNSSVDPDNMLSSWGIGRIKLAFAEKNPNDLFVFVAADLSRSVTSSYQPDYNGVIYGIYRPYYEKIKGGTIDENIGVENLAPNASNWFNVTTSSMATMAGTSLQYGMSIFIDDRSEYEQIYLGGEAILLGVDYNGEGRFTFSQITSASSADTAGLNVGINIHNILPMPQKHYDTMTAYDSMFLFVTSDMGAFRYYYDTVIGSLMWWKSSYGMNNLQTYKVSATNDGSVLSATQSNAIVYINTANSSLKSGNKIWSVNNPGYPYAANTTTYDNFQSSTYSGSGVNASAIYRTSPSVRKPILVSRPGTNLARTYSNAGDFDALNDQTWTYGHSDMQTFLNASMADNCVFDQFNTPTAFWESFDFDATIDSIDMSLTEYTIVRRNGITFDCKNGRELLVGDSILVQSDNLGYPFFHVMAKSDISGIASTVDKSSYTIGTGDTVLFKNADFKIKIPQPVQARALVATNVGAFICGKVLDFSRTINPNSAIENKWGNLAWARIYTTGNPTTANPSSESDLETMNKRINAVALTADGTSAFLAVDVYSSFNSYDHTNLVRISGLNDVDINNDNIFRGNNVDTRRFVSDTVATFNRQISSIVCDPTNANNLVLTFDGVISSDANIMQTTNALSSNVDFTDISLNINRDNSTAAKDKPVFTALYESINSGKSASSGRIYAGSDDGLYYRENGRWISDNDDIPNVAVYDIWQQTKKLPKWVFYSYTGSNAESMVFEATENTGVMYIATYGRGIYMNSDMQDTNAIESTVSLNEIVTDNAKETLRIYPNPAIDQATIAYTLDNTANVEFRMYDVNGKEVSSFNVGRQSRGDHFQLIDVQTLQRGVYMIQMVTESSVKNAKLIVK